MLEQLFWLLQAGKTFIPQLRVCVKLTLLNSHGNPFHQEVPSPYMTTGILNILLGLDLYHLR